MLFKNQCILCNYHFFLWTFNQEYVVQVENYQNVQPPENWYLDFHKLCKDPWGWVEAKAQTNKLVKLLPQLKLYIFLRVHVKRYRKISKQFGPVCRENFIFLEARSREKDNPSRNLCIPRKSSVSSSLLLDGNHLIHLEQWTLSLEFALLCFTGIIITSLSAFSYTLFFINIKLVSIFKLRCLKK